MYVTKQIYNIRILYLCPSLYCIHYNNRKQITRANGVISDSSTILFVPAKINNFELELEQLHPM